MKGTKKIVVIGAGAAGYFAAISVAKHHPKATIILLEKSAKTLSKVRVSGGGRCNVMHACDTLDELLSAYPRGNKQLKGIFYQFGMEQTQAWFENRGVPLKTEKDGRMFPQTDTSETVVNVLTETATKAGVQLQTNQGVETILPLDDGGWHIVTRSEQRIKADAVIIATGGAPKAKNLAWIEQLSHEIVSPVPSLFTFNMPKQPITQLMGVVAPQAQVRLVGSKITTQGPLLITHWGMSGPAILKASSIGARLLAEKNYEFHVRIHWDLTQNSQSWTQLFEETARKNPKKKLANLNPSQLPLRLWIFLIEKAKLSKDRLWADFGKKNINRLVETLTNDEYAVVGKTTFKEEFVTCGGVGLSNINMQTMASKIHPNLYFAGEVLDIDALTGGYNFQAAWSSGYVAGKLQ